MADRIYTPWNYSEWEAVSVTDDGQATDLTESRELSEGEWQEALSEYAHMLKSLATQHGLSVKAFDNAVRTWENHKNQKATEGDSVTMSSDPDQAVAVPTDAEIPAETAKESLKAALEGTLKATPAPSGADDTWKSDPKIIETVRKTYEAVQKVEDPTERRKMLDSFPAQVRFAVNEYGDLVRKAQANGGVVNLSETSGPWNADREFPADAVYESGFGVQPDMVAYTADYEKFHGWDQEISPEVQDIVKNFYN
jgi:hypothetical protein